MSPVPGSSCRRSMMRLIARLGGDPRLLQRGARVLFAIACLTTACVSSALFAAAQDSRSAVRETVLPSGLRVVVEERLSTETAAVRLLIGGGTLGEPATQRGVATLHARMLLRGTTSHSGSELARAAEDMGGRLSSYAGSRSETISLDVPAERCTEGIRLVLEILRHPRFEPSDLEKEKSLLLSSLAASKDDPTSDLEDEVLRALFRDHPLARLVRLKEADVRAISLDDVRRFHDARFTDDRLALVVVGRCRASEVEAAAAAAFEGVALHPPDVDEGSRIADGSHGESPNPHDARDSKLCDDPGNSAPGQTEPGARDAGVKSRVDESGPGPAGSQSLSGNRGGLGNTPVPTPEPLADDLHDRVRKRTTQAEIMVALPTSGVSDEDTPAYGVLRFVLGGFQERLSGEIREKRGYAYWLTAEGLSFPTAGWFGIHTGAKKKYLDAIETIIRTELVRIAEEPPTEEEIERAHRYLTTSEARLDATNGGRASILAVALLDGRLLRSYEERIARLTAVTPDQVRRLARRLFAGKHMAVVTMH